MAEAAAQQTADLATWSDLREHTDWPTLLVGNGASINLWSEFAYPSLHKRADLSPVAQEVFGDLKTTNFELVLEAIHHAHVVVGALGDPTEAIDEKYNEVRDALFNAVRGAHVEWKRFTTDRFDRIASALQDHRAVFTTNYDLCMYWAHLDATGRVTKRDVKDFFWNPGCTFDPDNVEFGDHTAMYYLHGAIHLWQDDGANNGKWTSANGGNLLVLAGNYSPGARKLPLFVSEGSSKAKLQTIGRSPYLRFCLDSLRADRGNTVVLGHSLSSEDEHVAAALREGGPREIAVSIYPHIGPQKIIGEKARITELLGDIEPTFFDSTTHPLGSPSLKIAPPDAI